MKKGIMLFVLMMMLLQLASCSKIGSETGIDDITKYLSSIEKYEATCELTMLKNDKTVKNDIVIDYLNPNYYKVVFKSKTGSEQIILKNNDGVFVLNPSLNKEFKFNSEWPNIHTHAYLIDGIVKEIKADKDASSKLENDVLTIECKLSNAKNGSRLKFEYNVKENKPVSIIFYDSNNKQAVKAKFLTFGTSKNITKDDFNQKIILDENDIEKNNDANSPTIAITAGYVLDGTTLTSTKLTEDSAILCYTGDCNYTITVAKAVIYDTEIALETYNDFEIIESGLMLVNDRVVKYFDDEYEICVYSKDLELEKILSIVSAISLTK